MFYDMWTLVSASSVYKIIHEVTLVPFLWNQIKNFTHNNQNKILKLKINKLERKVLL